ncbi:autotransporter-associated beta strand repeat-containing protein, partial [Pseudomonadota bacterium]|nr:autotransporter-associated beta strand repeat-containing protein [Pseudomonadota bacterium]
LIDIPTGMTITSSLSSGSTTFSGDLSGDGNFVKDGNYTLTLSGSNSITGTKTINAGILSISSDNNLGAVPGSVQSSHLTFGGGTLQTTADFTLNANRGINLSGNGTIHTNTSTQLDYGGLIQGSGSLTKSGSGTLLFTTANNFTGNLNLDGGTLSISAVDQLGTTTGSNTITFDGGTLLATSDFTLDTNRGISLDGNGGFNVDSGVVLDYAGVISGSGALTKSGVGNFLISGVNTYSGDTVITAGTLQVTGTLADTTDVIVSLGALYNVDEDDIIQSLESAGNIDIANTKTLQTGDSGNNAISGVISGAGSLVKLGSGTLTLSGTNANTGSMGIQAGTLSISTDRNLGAVPGSVVADSIILNGGTFQSTGTTSLDSNRGVTISASSTIEVDGSSTDLTIPGIISGGAGANLTKNGAGRLIMGGVNTYAGSTSINAGTFSVSADSGLGAVPGSTTADHLTINGGILQSTSGFTLNSKRGITLGASSGTINTINSSQINYVGVIAGSSNLTKNGDGRILLIGNSTYTGNTVISEGTFSNLGTLADTTNVSVASGAIYDVDNTDTINSLSGAGNVELSSGVTLTTGDTGDDTISGVISGAGNLVKAGSGELRLTGTNTYTGTTTINAGDLRIFGDSALGAAPGSATPGHLTFNGGTLQALDSDFSINSNRGIALGPNHGTIEVNTGNTVTYGGIIAGSNNLTKGWGGTLALSGSNTYSGSTTITDGTVSISSSDNLGPTPGSLDADNIILDGGTLSASTSFTLGSNKGITLNSASTIHVNTSSVLTYPGTISGSAGYFKTGAGTLLLSGTNTYTGYTNIDGGTVQVTGTLSSSTTVDNEGVFDVDTTNTVASVFGSGNVQLASGITLTTGDSNNRRISGVVSGAGNLVKVGSGRLTLSGINTYTGTSTISSGVLKISGLLGSGSYSANIINNSTLNYDSSSNQNLSGVISGTGLLTQDGSGTLTLSGINTYAGTTTINSGTINISADSGLGSAPGSATAGHLTLNGGTLQSSADFTMNANRGVALGSSHGTFNVDTGTTLTVGGVVAGSNNLIKSGDGRLILSEVNTYSGNTTISSGTLEVSGLLGSGTYSANISNSGTFEYSSSSNQTISGVISGTGDIVKGGTGELTLSGSNTYSLMTMNDGFIIISSDSGLGVPPGSATPGHLTFNGGTLRTTASFTLNSNRGINLISQGTIITDPGTTLTYGGIIAGTGNFIKDGTGKLVLSGSNTNTGYIKIQAGVLSVSSTSNLGAIPSSVDSDNIQIINGTLHVSSTFTLNSNKGILLQSGLGSAAAIFDIDSGQTLTISGVISGNGTASITKNGSGTLELTGINTHTATTDINAGSLSIDSDSALGATPGSATAGHLTIDASLITTADFTLNPNRGIAISSGYTAHLKPASGTSLTYGGIIAGAGNIRNWYGTTILGGVNTYTGTTTARSGTISISSDRNLGAVPGSATAGKIVLHGGTLKSTADFTIDSNRGISLGSQHGTINVDSGTTLTYNGITASSGRLTKSGTGKLVFGGANTYTGDTIINAGTFQTTGTLADTTDVSVSSGAIYDVDATDTIQSLSGAGNIELANSITLTTGDAGDDTISGVISGAGNFTKAGSGTLTLSGTNTYAGDTTISAGTLLTSGTLADTTDVLVSSGAILDVDITDTIQSLSGAGNIELASGITLTTGDTGNDTISGVISGVGNLVKIGSGTLTLSGTNTYTGSTTINVGAIRISADSGLGAAPSSITADHLTINGGTLTSTADFT